MERCGEGCGGGKESLLFNCFPTSNKPEQGLSHPELSRWPSSSSRRYWVTAAGQAVAATTCTARAPASMRSPQSRGWSSPTSPRPAGSCLPSPLVARCKILGQRHSWHPKGHGDFMHLVWHEFQRGDSVVVTLSLPPSAPGGAEPPAPPSRTSSWSRHRAPSSPALGTLHRASSDQRSKTRHSPAGSSSGRGLQHPEPWKAAVASRGW